MYIRTIKKTVG